MSLFAGSSSKFTSGSGSSIRLVNGPTYKEGRVELWLGEQWNPVCDNGWDINDANVVCRSLGYSGASEAPCSAQYGRGMGGIILDDMECSGLESSLYTCRHNGLYVHNCGHGGDASAVCELN